MDTVNTRFKWEEATGAAKYIADRHYEGLLEGRFYRSSCPRGRIKSVTLPSLPDGYHIFGADDVPGQNVLPIVEIDWPAFADQEVRFIGQVIFLVVGPDPDVVDSLLNDIDVDYEPLEPAYTIEQSKALKDGAIHATDNVLDTHALTKGDIQAGFANAVTIIEETCSTGYQEHIYLETQGAVCYPQDGKVVLEGSMQCPWYVHHTMAVVLGHDNVRAIQCPTGGGFGGKEDFPDVLAAPLAVAVEKLQQPIRLIFERGEDIATTSKRHPVTFNYKTGVDADGNIVAMDIKFDVNAGAYLSLSGIVLQRSITTATNVYDIPNVRVEGHAWATNTVPTGAFRGFGSPQNCFCMETHIHHVAKQLGADPLAFKQRHMLTSQSHSLTGAEIFGELVLDEMLQKVLDMSDYQRKSAEFSQIEETHPERRKGKSKGIGLAIFQHGCGFAGDLEDTLVRAKVKLLKEPDGTVQILASNTDIGQGLSLTFRKIVADTLNKPLDQVQVAVPDTGIVPDSGPTVASRSILIVGYILEKAAKKLKKSWIDGEAQEIVEVYCKPDYHQWDQDTYQGNAYQATSYGANVVEVEVDMATGEADITGAWAVYDIGKAIDGTIFRGQIEGGLVQALGYGSCEKLELNQDGVFAQRSMADYVIPTALDVPAIGSDLVDNPYPYGPNGAKGGGELTHNGGAAAFAAAVENAIGMPLSSIPVTPEKVCEVLASGNTPQLKVTQLKANQIKATGFGKGEPINED
ncbi:xanthine dehydrogenase family protein molybdopterin-binding subunit [Photobacterium lutimaris]|uniref:Xanthine dehydrogenase n=1 Tax=Photobacterium lutimaris TaxID=388278 RepID=A0A2T3IL46_9GAMM|nr:xanthine dehydrogenase family protein molybdopterin-binding subunit [Photobacterium lutimaris]PSU29081.1 xanthine dehydrogenase [Photobacterium lutimaris]TDR75691.1 CO/xanthine dehydrogenase Mo-binding subunit [Photobacterium lutimaris]